MSREVRPLASTGSLVLWGTVVLVATAVSAAVPLAAEGGAPLQIPRHRVDIARADRDELALLPGVGPALAARIVSARARAPFQSVDDLARVEGLGDATLDGLRGDAVVGGRDRR